MSIYFVNFAHSFIRKSPTTSLSYRRFSRIKREIKHVIPSRPHIELTVPETICDIDDWLDANVNVPRKCYIGFDVEWSPNVVKGRPQ